MLGSAVTLLLAVCLFGKGYGYDEELTCPGKFIVEKVNTLTLQVNSAVIKNADCAVPPRFLEFTIKRIGAGTVSTICSTEFSCPSPGPVGEPSQEQPACGCVRKSQNNILLFEMKLYVEETKDSGANFSFNLCSRPVQPVSQNIVPSCTKITVGMEESTTIPSVHGTGYEEGPCGTGCIVGIVVGVIGLIAIIVGIVLFMRSRGFKGMPVRGANV